MFSGLKISPLSDEVEPCCPSAKLPVDSKWGRGSRRAQICSNPNAVGADDERRDTIPPPCMFKRRVGNPDGDNADNWLVVEFCALFSAFSVSNDLSVEYFGLCWTRPVERPVLDPRTTRIGVFADGGGLNDEFKTIDDVDVELWLPGENADNWFGVLATFLNVVDIVSALGGEYTS